MCDTNCDLIAPLLFALAMALHFNINIAPAEYIDQLGYSCAASFFSTVHDG